MGNGLALVVLLQLLIACGGKTKHSYDLDEDPALGSHAGAGRSAVGGANHVTSGESLGGATGTGASASIPEEAEAVEACATPPVPRPWERLPPSSPLVTGTATVVAASTNGLELDTALGASHFGWVGPSLTDFFAPGDQVEVSTFQNWGEPEDDWHIVESDSVMIGTLEGSWAAPLSPSPGWHAGPSSPTGLPSLSFVNAGCCQRDDNYECDYSNLIVAQPYPDSLLITQGATETFHGWTITNLGAMWDDDAIFSVALTVIGPARHRE